MLEGENISPTPSPELKPWYETCSSDIEYFTQERYDDGSLAEDNAVQIHFDQIGKVDCFDQSMLQQFFKSTKPVVIWVPNRDLELVQHLGHPNRPRKLSMYFYRNPGQFGGFFTETVVFKIIKGEKNIHVIKYPKDVVVGNREFSFGISELHGQEPGVTIYLDSSENPDSIKFYIRHTFIIPDYLSLKKLAPWSLKDVSFNNTKISIIKIGSQMSGSKSIDLPYDIFRDKFAGIIRITGFINDEGDNVTYNETKFVGLYRLPSELNDEYISDRAVMAIYHLRGVIIELVKIEVIDETDISSHIISYYDFLHIDAMDQGFDTHKIWREFFLQYSSVYSVMLKMGLIFSMLTLDIAKYQWDMLTKFHSIYSIRFSKVITPSEIWKMFLTGAIVILSTIIDNFSIGPNMVRIKNEDKNIEDVAEILSDYLIKYYEMNKSIITNPFATKVIDAWKLYQITQNCLTNTNDTIWKLDPNNYIIKRKENTYCYSPSFLKNYSNNIYRNEFFEDGSLNLWNDKTEFKYLIEKLKIDPYWTGGKISELYAKFYPDDRDYCNNENDFHNSPVIDILNENFIHLTSPTGQVYCYDVNQLIQQLTTSLVNKHPYDKQPIWKTRDEFDKIVLHPMVSEIDRKILIKRFYPTGLEPDEKKMIMDNVGVFLLIGAVGFIVTNDYTDEFVASQKAITFLRDKIGEMNETSKNLFNNFVDYFTGRKLGKLLACAGKTCIHGMGQAIMRIYINNMFDMNEPKLIPPYIITKNIGKYYAVMYIGHYDNQIPEFAIRLYLYDIKSHGSQDIVDVWGWRFSYKSSDFIDENAIKILDQITYKKLFDFLRDNFSKLNYAGFEFIISDVIEKYNLTYFYEPQYKELKFVRNYNPPKTPFFEQFIRKLQSNFRSYIDGTYEDVSIRIQVDPLKRPTGYLLYNDGHRVYTYHTHSRPITDMLRIYVGWDIGNVKYAQISTITIHGNTSIYDDESSISNLKDARNKINLILDSLANSGELTPDQYNSSMFNYHLLADFSQWIILKLGSRFRFNIFNTSDNYDTIITILYVFLHELLNIDSNQLAQQFGNISEKIFGRRIDVTPEEIVYLNLLIDIFMDDKQKVEKSIGKISDHRLFNILAYAITIDRTEIVKFLYPLFLERGDDKNNDFIFIAFTSQSFNTIKVLVDLGVKTSLEKYPEQPEDGLMTEIVKYLASKFSASITGIADKLIEGYYPQGVKILTNKDIYILAYYNEDQIQVIMEDSEFLIDVKDIASLLKSDEVIVKYIPITDDIDLFAISNDE